MCSLRLQPRLLSGLPRPLGPGGSGGRAISRWTGRNGEPGRGSTKLHETAEPALPGCPSRAGGGGQTPNAVGLPCSQRTRDRPSWTRRPRVLPIRLQLCDFLQPCPGQVGEIHHDGGCLPDQRCRPAGPHWGWMAFSCKVSASKAPLEASGAHQLMRSPFGVRASSGKLLFATKRQLVNHYGAIFQALDQMETIKPFQKKKKCNQC